MGNACAAGQGVSVSAATQTDEGIFIGLSPAPIVPPFTKGTSVPSEASTRPRSARMASLALSFPVPLDEESFLPFLLLVTLQKISAPTSPIPHDFILRVGQLLAQCALCLSRSAVSCEGLALDESSLRRVMLASGRFTSLCPACLQHWPDDPEKLAGVRGMTTRSVLQFPCNVNEGVAERLRELLDDANDRPFHLALAVGEAEQWQNFLPLKFPPFESVTVCPIDSPSSPIPVALSPLGDVDRVHPFRCSKALLVKSAQLSVPVAADAALTWAKPFTVKTLQILEIVDSPLLFSDSSSVLAVLLSQLTALHSLQVLRLEKCGLGRLFESFQSHGAQPSLPPSVCRDFQTFFERTPYLRSVNLSSNELSEWMVDDLALILRTVVAGFAGGPASRGFQLTTLNLGDNPVLVLPHNILALWDEHLRMDLLVLGRLTYFSRSK
jgi:hypothetical protein